MKEVILEAEVRTISTKSALKAIRTQGKIPAVFYGHNEKTMHISVNTKKFIELVRANGSNVLIDLKIENVDKSAIIKEIQKDIISQEPIHIDFQAISLKEKIEVNIPLHIVGVAPGVKSSGGILEHLLRETRVKCLPSDMPKFINVDISSLQINDAYKISDLPKIEGVEYVTDPEAIIVNVVAPTIEEEKPAAAAAEPEVISKGKKEEAGTESKTPEKK